MTHISQLKGVPETLLIPLMGRALETLKERKKEKCILNDPKSLEIFKSLDYDFDKFRDRGSHRSMQRTTIRTAIIDRLVLDFMERHPAAAIVELGCGLNSRYERVGGGSLRWFDLDVPEVYQIWKTFFHETKRRTFLPYSAFDDTWLQKLKEEHSGPCLFISEASVIYFPEKRVRRLFEKLHRNFTGSCYLFDSATPAFLESLEKNNDALQYCSARLKWAIKDMDVLKNWISDIQIIRTVELESSQNEFSFLYPPGFKKDAEGYRLNLVRL